MGFVRSRVIDGMIHTDIVTVFELKIRVQSHSLDEINIRFAILWFCNMESQTQTLCVELLADNQGNAATTHREVSTHVGYCQVRHLDYISSTIATS
jgi:hypothetical protein